MYSSLIPSFEKNFLKAFEVYSPPLSHLNHFKGFPDCFSPNSLKILNISNAVIYFEKINKGHSREIINKGNKIPFPFLCQCLHWTTNI
jgi:hypothetical protein